MPLYNYLCSDCGPFDAWRAMAEAEHDCACPSCLKPGRRLVSTPHINLMNASLRRALARSEQSSSEPRVVKKAHLAGCGCALCKTGSRRPSVRHRWMVGH